MEDLDRSAELFAALGDRTRLALVMKLSREGPQSIKDLAADSGCTRQAVSQHLDLLSQAGLVQGERDGRMKIYAIQTSRCEDVKRCIDAISAGWDRAIERLRNVVESEAEPQTEGP